MAQRTRGIITAALIVVSAVFVIWDAIDNGFSARDWIALAGMAIVLVYALSWIRDPAPRHR